MFKKIIFFVLLVLIFRPIYFSIRLFTFGYDNLSQFGKGSLLGNIILILVILLILIILGKKIWRNKN